VHKGHIIEQNSIDINMDSDRRQHLLRQRAVARGMLTRIQHFIEAGEHKINEIQVRFNKLSDIFNRYDTAQSELELLDDTDHSGDRELFENQYYEVEARFIEILHPADTQGRSADNQGQSDNDSEAKQLIANLQISHDNFVVAWDLVTQRYNNIKLIAMTHVKQLLQLPQVKRNDATSLRHLINHVTSNMNAIQALALNTSMQDLMLNHLLLSVLDSETHKEWELQNATQQNIPTTSTVINFLEARCKALELLQASQSTSTTTSQQSPTSRTKFSQSSCCNLVTQDQCPLCKGTHRLVQCGKFKGMPPWQRKDYAQQIRACYNCLRPYSKSHNCSKDSCRVCNKRHHTLLHVNAQNSSASDRRSNTNHNPSANQRNSAPPEVNTYCSLKSRPTNQVLLATAIVEMKNKYN